MNDTERWLRIKQENPVLANFCENLINTEKFSSTSFTSAMIASSRKLRGILKCMIPEKYDRDHDRPVVPFRYNLRSQFTRRHPISD